MYYAQNKLKQKVLMEGTSIIHKSVGVHSSARLSLQRKLLSSIEIGIIKSNFVNILIPDI